MKRIFTFILLLILALMIGCESTNHNEKLNNHCVVPDVYNIPSSVAEQIIINSGLIPVIVNQESDDITSGNVIKCSPEIGTEVDANTRITMYISVGKGEQVAKSYECGDLKNEGFFNFELQRLSIKNEYLNMVFEVEPLYDSGYYNYIKLDFLGEGILTFNQMNKEIPITYTYDKKRIKYKEKQTLSVSVPIDKFDGEKIVNIKLAIDFNINQPDWNFNPYDTTSTSSTSWWNIEW